MTGTTTRPADDAPVSPAGPPDVSPLRRARYRLRTYASEHPPLYLAYVRRKWTQHDVEVIDSRTELVIDGFTRSASTFSVYAFQLSQHRPVRLAHHLHAPAQLIQAARWGIPAIALIREPRGAILSRHARWPDAALADALVAYARFYERLRPYRSSLVVGEFETVTHDFGALVRQLNERYGTDFTPFASNDANMRECLEFCKLRATFAPVLLGFESGLVTRDQVRSERPAIARGAVVDEREAFVPSAHRDQQKEALRRQWQQASLNKLRSRAQRAYEEFVAG